MSKGSQFSTAIHTVYVIDGPRGTAYVGCTARSMSERWRDHWRSRMESDSPFRVALRKHGASAFKPRALVQCRGYANGRAMEIAVIGQMQRDGVKLYNRNGTVESTCAVYLDGQMWRLAPGIDFYSPDEMRRAVKNTAYRRDLSARVMTDPDGFLYIQVLEPKP